MQSTWADPTCERRTRCHTVKRGPGVVDPPPDGQLEQIIEVMLGTSARIGEAPAIRACDLDDSVSPMTVHLCGSLITRRGMPTYRLDRPKSSSSVRTAAVQDVTAKVLRERLAKVEGKESDVLLFFSRTGTPLTPNNIRRRLRRALDAAEIPGVHPHLLGKTVAAFLDRVGALGSRRRCSATRPRTSPRSTTSSPMTGRIL